MRHCEACKLYATLHFFHFSILQAQFIHTLLAADDAWAAIQKSILHADFYAGTKRFALAKSSAGAVAAHQIDMFQPSLEVRIELRKV
jgi:hypothetical protein